MEAGLIVSVLVATVVRSGRSGGLARIWTGVLAAAALALSFGAVLTFTAAGLPAGAADTFGGSLSLVAVAFVTAMVFWMRRSARTLSGNLKERVTAALGLGGGMLVVTAFLAVAREGLETSLFLWTTAQAEQQTAGPMIGAVTGLAVAVALCCGLYRRVLKINLTRFFTVTGAVLVVIAAGVLAYGLGDLQEGGVLPGGQAYAFDLSRSVDSGSWYATLVQGVFNLSPRMSLLQVAGYVVYLVLAMGFFLRGIGLARVVFTLVGGGSPAPGPVAEQTAVRRRPAWAVPVLVVAVPGAVAASAIAVGGGQTAGAGAVAVSAADCGKGFTAPQPGRQVFQMRNTGDRAAEVYLIDPAGGAVYGEIEGLAPGTTRALTATIGAGDYAWRCIPNGQQAVTSATVHVGGTAAAVAAVQPVGREDLKAPLDAYRQYVAQGLADLGSLTAKVQADVHAGDLAAARADWLTAHLRYAGLGAAYGTFGDFDKKIDGRPDGLPARADDDAFTGFLRLEYGLWHGQSADRLAPVADRLAADVTGLAQAFPTQDFDPTDLPLRTHEILENTLQFELTADTDQGSGTNLATAQANLAGTRELLTVLTPLIRQRSPQLLETVNADVQRVADLLATARHPDGGWTPVQQLDTTARTRLNGAVGQLLEDLAPIPDLLEIRKAA
ncbi:iron uptake transporter permease EfeU [Kitasatospora sp. HPMI-4]|uniref:iron uptake transporter permease EfeU n=1 Tax=Kitasatospora sp. HPMI-4 TaxID=3448443 RepID=UPI003F1DD7B6